MHQDQSYIQDVYSASLESNKCRDCPAWMKEIWNPDYNSNEGSIALTYVAPAIPLAAIDGPFPAADLIIAAALAAVSTYDLSQRVYITYIAYNPSINAHYCGRASGFGTPQTILENRLYLHHAVSSGYIVEIDRSIQGYPIGYWCIRGREQQNIDYYGGALSDSERRPDASCINKILGVAKFNPLGYLYYLSSTIAWGEKHKYTGYGTQDITELWKY